MAGERLTFDITGDATSGARAFRQTADSAVLAARGAKLLADELKQQARSAKVAEDATYAVARADAILAVAEDRVEREAKKADRTLEAQRLRLKGRSTLFGGLFGGGLPGGGGTGASGLFGGVAGLGPAAGGGIPLLGALGSTGGIGALVAAGAAPFLGAGVGGGILGGLGAGIAGLGIFGALSTGKAPAAVSTLQLATAQNRLATSQAALNRLQASGKATALQLASGQLAVASAQDKLNTLQKQAAASDAWKAQNDGVLKVRAAFSGLFSAVQTGIRTISVPFQGVLISIADSFRQVLPDILQPLSVALQTMAPAIKLVGDTLAKSFGSPAVAGAINEVGLAFTQFLKAFAPQIPGIVDAVAKGITGLAEAFTDHPGMIAAMSSVLAFLFRLPGYAVAALGALARVANWLSTGFPHAISIGLDAARGFFIAFGHGTEVIFNDIVTNVRAAFDRLELGILGAAKTIIHGLADAFGWVPFGLGSSLKKADAALGGWIASVQARIDSLHGVTVPVNIVFKVNGATTSISSAAIQQFGGFGHFAAGTLGAAPGWAWVGEHGPELVRFRGGETVIPNQVATGYAAGTGGGGNVTLVLENHGVIGSQAELDNWLHRSVDRLAMQGRLSWALRQSPSAP